MTDDQTPFAYGAIYGTRTWCIDRTGYLTGVIYKQRWTPGENLATCRNVRRDMVDHVTGRSFTIHNGIPDDHPGYPIEPGHMVECSNGRIGIAGPTGRAAGFGGCGFHAYLQGSNDYKNSGDASGVVALYGRGVVGTLGGRFMKARIVALFLPRTLAEAMDDDQHRYYSPRHVRGGAREGRRPDPRQLRGRPRPLPRHPLLRHVGRHVARPPHHTPLPQGAVMNVFQWILVGWFVLNALFTIALVGREREPGTPLGAIIAQFIYAGLILVVVLS